PTLDSSALRLATFDVLTLTSFSPLLLASGASYTIADRQVFIPPNAGIGPKFLLFVADDQNRQPESDEVGNNVMAVPITLSAPDLVVTDVSAPSAAVVNQSVAVQWTVANRGAVAAINFSFDGDSGVAWYDSVYISTSSTFDATARNLGYFSHFTP